MVDCKVELGFVESHSEWGSGVRWGLVLGQQEPQVVEHGDACEWGRLARATRRALRVQDEHTEMSVLGC